MQVFITQSIEKVEGVKKYASEKEMEVRNEEAKQSKKAFLKEFAKGYFDAERMKKMELLNEYKVEYDNLEDKDSFKGQYLESWIYVLTQEIKN